MRPVFAFIFVVAFLPPINFAAAQDTGRAAILSDLVSCRSISDEEQRLDCYDRKVARLDIAEREKQIVVLDKEQLRDRRRNAFGLGKDDQTVQNAEPEIDQVETVVESVESNRAGKLSFTTKIGGHWIQIDDRHPFGVKPGKKVTLKEAAFGSYFANFEGTIAVRVKRVQ